MTAGGFSTAEATFAPSGEARLRENPGSGRGGGDAAIDDDFGRGDVFRLVGGEERDRGRNVREAIALALDYEGIIDLTVAGQGNLQAAPIPNGFPGTDDLPLPARDLDRARELLEEEGLGDGVSMEAMFPGINVYGVDLSLMMQKVQQDLADVGIEISLQPVTFSVWRERITNEGIPLTAVFYAPDYFGSGQYVQFFGMMEGTAWHARAHAARALDAENPDQAELLARALAASEEESANYFRQLAEEMINDRIIIPVVSPNLVLAYRNDIEGVRYSACCNLPTVELQRK